MKRKRKQFASEAEMAQVLAEWLEQDGTRDVYHEVQLVPGGPKADLVVVEDCIVNVVEAKLSPTFEAVKQARKWRDDAHRIAIAVPYIYDIEERELCIEICEHLKVGLCFVGDLVTVPVVGPYNPHASDRIIDRINEFGHEYKSRKYAQAGTREGNHVSPFSVTMNRLREFVLDNPGVRLSHAVSNIEHHWNSDARARSEIGKLIQRGGVKGIRAERRGGPTVLFPMNQEACA